MATLAQATDSGTSAEKRRILAIGDDPATTRLLSGAAEHGRVVEFARDAAGALARIEHQPYDVCVAGLHDPTSATLAFLRDLRRRHPDLKIVVVTPLATAAQILESLREHAFGHVSLPVSPTSLAETIDRAIEEPPADDGIEVVSAREAWLELRLKCRMRTAEQALRFLNDWDATLPAKEGQDVATALREMVLNAMEHGGHMNPDVTVDVTCLRTPRLILYEIRDPGDGFSMESLRHAAVSNPTDEPAAHVLYRSEQAMRSGGFGILISKSLVDELIYNEKGNGVVLIKYTA